MQTKEKNIKNGLEIIIQLIRKYYKNAEDVNILLVKQQIKKGC